MKKFEELQDEVNSLDQEFKSKKEILDSIIKFGTDIILGIESGRILPESSIVLSNRDFDYLSCILIREHEDKNHESQLQSIPPSVIYHKGVYLRRKDAIRVITLE